jgi:hypothetical protein
MREVDAMVLWLTGFDPLLSPLLFIELRTSQVRIFPMRVWAARQLRFKQLPSPWLAYLEYDVA